MAGKTSGVRGDGGGREAYIVAENLGVGRQRVGGGVDLLHGIDTPRVKALPWGDETLRVDTEGDRVTGEKRWGRGGHDNLPTT